MTQYQVAHVDGAHRVYATETGMAADRTYFEPVFRKPRPAIEYSDELAGRAAATGAGQGAPEPPETGDDGGPRSAEPVGGRQRPSESEASLWGLT